MTGLQTKSTPPKRSNANSAGDAARTKLLDAAERLFADRGFFGVSIRDITDLADQRLSAVNYHFESKEGLFGKVLERRGTIINQERRELLQQYLSRPRGSLKSTVPEHIRAIVRAFYMPLLIRFGSNDEGWRCYGRLISGVALNKDWNKRYMSPLFDQVCGEFVDHFLVLAPDAGDRKALHCVQFMIGLQLYIFSDNDREATLSQGRFRSSDLFPMAQSMEDFCVAGILRLLGLE
jgi:AcrR family transcriptional regulator